MPSDDENNETATHDFSTGGDESNTRHVDTPKDPKAGANLGGAQKDQTYKPHQRNPLYSGAENSCLWELNRLSRHYHPSVCLFARTLMEGGDIEYKGDPLQDFTLMRFLDRFVYKNPKKKERDHGGSLMQPKTSSSRLAEEPVNTKSFLVKKEEDIREDELFFHRYFKQKAEKENKRKKKKRDSDDEIETPDNATNFDNIQDERSSVEFDFASVLKSPKKPGASKNKTTGSDEEDGDEDEEQSKDESESGDEDVAEKEHSSSGEEFDYDAMGFSSSEEEDAEESVSSKDKKRNPTEKDYEKALLENLSSDEFSEDEESQITKKKSKKMHMKGSDDVSSMFASAEEFAHLLESSKASHGGSYDVKREGASDKQLKWEEKKAGKNWNKKRGNWGRGRGGLRKGPRKEANFNSKDKFKSKGRGAKRKR